MYTCGMVNIQSMEGLTFFVFLHEASYKKFKCSYRYPGFMTGNPPKMTIIIYGKVYYVNLKVKTENKIKFILI